MCFALQILFFRSQRMWLSKYSSALFECLSLSKNTGTVKGSCWASKILPVCNNHVRSFLQIKKKKLSPFLCRPAFLPDPNDGSLYSLGGKNNEGLTVREREPRKNSTSFFYGKLKYVVAYNMLLLEKWLLGSFVFLCTFKSWNVMLSVI